MNFKDYQTEAWKTAIHPNAGKNYVYPTLGLTGEAGEIANKIKKIERDHGGVVNDEVRKAVGDELGDLLWYAAALATELELDLESVAKGNLEKIASRQERGQLMGNGDVR